MTVFTDVEFQRVDCDIYTFAFKRPRIVIHTFLVPSNTGKFMFLLSRMKALGGVDGVSELLQFLCTSNSKMELSVDFLADNTEEILIREFNVIKLPTGKSEYTVMNPNIINVGYNCVNPIKCRIMRAYYYVW
jgi:hypothetical protein